MERADIRRTRSVRRAVALTAVLVVGYVAGWAWVWRDGPQASVVSDGVALVTALTGCGLALATARRLTGPSRRAWLLFAAGLFSWFLGEAVYGWYDVIAPSDEAPFPGLADVGYLSAYAFCALGLLTLPSAPAGSTSRLRWTLDGILLAGALLIISWVVVLGPWLHSEGGGTALVPLLVGLAYPVGDLVLITLALSGLRRSRFGGRLSVGLVVSAIMLTAVADSVYLVKALDDTFVDGTPLDLGWYLCYLLIGIAGLAYQPDVHPDTERPLQGIGLAGPYLAFGIAMPFLGWQFWRTGALESVLVVTAALCSVGICVRQWLTTRDNAELTTALSGRQRELHELAFRDPLTGLANRALLSDRMQQGLAGRSPRVTAVLAIDLDDFKQVNDSHGHAAGDELLVAVAARIGGCVRPHDTVARLGGDEFAVVLEAPGGAADVLPLEVAERICRELRVGYRCSFGEVFVSSSVGVALRDGTTVGADLLRNADLAMYEAKSRGGDGAWVYELELHEAVVRRHVLESDLRLAAERQELSVAYQPVVQLPSGRIVGVEALMRWDSPTHGSVAPAEFITVAESSGLLGALDARLLLEAGAQVVRWRAAGHDLTLAVNTSVRQVQSGAILPTVTDALVRTGLPAAALSLEITETVLLDDTARAIPVLEELRGLGVTIALDDFGTGYSSLAYLAELPVDRIKIDRSFVSGLGSGPRLSVLTEAVVWMGRRLGMEIVAEGVETAEQVELLVAMGCPLAQGYYYSAPLAAAEMTDRLRLPTSLAATGLVRQGTPAGVSWGV